MDNKAEVSRSSRLAQCSHQQMAVCWT